MKRAIVIAVVAVILSIPLTSSAQTCSSTISLGGSIPIKISTIRTALSNYSSYAVGDHYELCFENNEVVVNTTFFTSEFLIVTNAGESKDVYIVGLNIRNDSDNPVNIPILVTDNKGTGKIILKDIALKDVKNGVVLGGAGKTEIKSSKIAGDASKSGVCVEVKSNGAMVQSSEISGCGEGVSIAANDVLVGATSHEQVSTDKNSIHDNVLGLHVVSGKGNKFGYNLIYDNKPPLASEGAANDAILIEPGANEDLIPLETVLYEEEGKEYALRCERDASGNVIKREIYFNAPQTDGIATIYESDLNKQIKKYLTKCVIGADGICIIDSLPSEVMALIPASDCGIQEYHISAIFTGTGSTELPSDYMEMDGIAVIMAPVETGPVDMPTGVTDSGGDDDYTTEDGANSMGGEGGMISASGVASGCGGGGASLANDSFRSVVLDFNAWWVLLALSIVGAMRLTRSHK
ncbi:MAG: hypothetical protein WC683_12495 [bacterium]